MFCKWCNKPLNFCSARTFRPDLMKESTWIHPVCEECHARMTTQLNEELARKAGAGAAVAEERATQRRLLAERRAPESCTSESCPQCEGVGCQRCGETGCVMRCAACRFRNWRSNRELRAQNAGVR